MALKKITGLYLNKSKNGTQYMSGISQDGVKYLVFKNTKKEDKHPDYNLCIDDDEPSNYNENSNYSPSVDSSDDAIPF
jgi:hypothetical protein